MENNVIPEGREGHVDAFHVECRGVDNSSSFGNRNCDARGVGSHFSFADVTGGGGHGGGVYASGYSGWLLEVERTLWFVCEFCGVGMKDGGRSQRRDDTLGIYRIKYGAISFSADHGVIHFSTDPGDWLADGTGVRIGCQACKADCIYTHSFLSTIPVEAMRVLLSTSAIEALTRVSGGQISLYFA